VRRKTVDPLSVRIAVDEQVPPREPIPWRPATFSLRRFERFQKPLARALKIGAVSERVGAKRRLLPGGVDRQML
jgi:hypothetical protein